MPDTTDPRSDEWRSRWTPPAGTTNGDAEAHDAPAPPAVPSGNAPQPQYTPPTSAAPDPPHAPSTQQFPGNPPPAAEGTDPYAAPAGAAPYAPPTGTAPYAAPTGTDPYAPPSPPETPGASAQPTPPTGAAPYEPTATQQFPGIPPTPPAQGGSSYDQPPASGSQTSAWGASPAERTSRGPGWPAVIAAAVGAALLSAAATAGTVLALDDDPTSSIVSTAPRAQEPGPVTSSSVSSPDWRAVADAVEPSVVAVQLQGGQGSGVVFDKQGHILTNYHVVADGEQIGVILGDGRGYKAEIVGSDSTSDLAVLKIQDPPTDLVPATFGDSSAVKVGDPVMAVGNPLGLAGTVTTGIVSAVDRPVTTEQLQQRQPQEEFDPFEPFLRPRPQQQQQQQSEPVVTNAIQTDAAINPGNSGGALVDVQGRLIGINSSLASLGASFGGQAGNIGLGFAITVNQAKAIAEEIIKTKKVEHPWLGVNLTDKSVNHQNARRMAAVIDEVLDKGPAKKAGLLTGDAVIAVDGENVNGAQSLVAQLRERRPDTKVVLTVVRDGRTQDVSVTLGARPASTD